MKQHLCHYGGYLKCDNPNCEHRYALSEVLHLCSDVLEKIAQGDCSQKIDLKFERYAVQRLINSINKVSQEVSAMIDLTHELAIGICEHFDVLKRLHEGDFSATASEDSSVEIVRMLGQLINKQKETFLEYINTINKHKEEIRHLCEQQNEILSSVGVAILVSDEDMTVEFVNHEFEITTGYTKEEVIGKMKWIEFIPEDLVQKMIEYHRLRRISPSFAPRQYETKFKKKNGEIRDILLTVGLIPSTKKSIASIIDITERKRINEQIIHSQKMESLGLLSGRVAHEYNNILTGIVGFAGLLYSKLEDEHLKSFADKIINAGERAKNLSRALLDFSRKEKIEKISELNINKYLNKFSDFIRSLIGKDIQLNLILPDKEIFYKIDPTHLDVILMNLVTNARDAMPEGGELTIGLKESYLDSVYTYTHPIVKQGYYVVICVTDTGTGMDEETKKRNFEPFFTTKPEGKGTGLGLSTVFGLLKQYEGHIHAYSELGKGTTFKIYLPLKEKKEKVALDKNRLKGSETILVVDDDDQARSYISLFLKEFGYKAIEAKDGIKALELYENHKEEIALSMIDLVIPGLPGVEIARKIREIKPDAKILIMSGHPVNLKDMVSVEKGLIPEEILLKIRNMIDGIE